MYIVKHTRCSIKKLIFENNLKMKYSIVFLFSLPIAPKNPTSLPFNRIHSSNFSKVVTFYENYFFNHKLSCFIFILNVLG